MSGFPHARMILFTLDPGGASCPSGQRMIADDARVFSDSDNKTIAVIMLFISTHPCLMYSIFCMAVVLTYRFHY